MNMVKVTIDNKEVEVPADYTVLKACKAAKVNIPTLCYLEEINQIGACRMCLVEIEGVRGLNTACTFPVSDGMIVKTNTPKVREARKVNLELILSNHKRECTTCVRSRNCELQTIAKELNITDIEFDGERLDSEIDNLSPSIVRDNSKCILCRRCVAACKKKEGITAIQAVGRGFTTEIRAPFGESLKEFDCIGCGQCIEACPVGALYEKNNTQDVWDIIADSTKVVVVQIAPAVRAALGEEFGYPIGTSVTKKMVTAVKNLGFDYVFDTNTSADLTIMEEGNELIDRVKNNSGKLPLITSCCPGWIKTCEQSYPELLENLSSCKSPQGMMGSILKAYVAPKLGIDKKDMIVVSIMPCTAKKGENERQELLRDNMKDVDISLTTRELAQMIREAGMNFGELEDSEFDMPLGAASGAGLIFGVTGGVTEAAMRTAVEIISNGSAKTVEFENLRGNAKIREYEVEAGGVKLKGAIVSGIANAKELLDEVVKGKSEYHFIEVMACEGGCICGGGQPIVTSRERMDVNIYEARAKVVYGEDKSLPVRKSHENEFIKKVYEEFLEKPLSHKAHELLHTTYNKKEKYPTE